MENIQKVYFFDLNNENIFMGWRYEPTDYILKDNETLIEPNTSYYNMITSFNIENQEWIYTDPPKYGLREVRLS